MHFGWKRLIPVALLWTVLVAAIRAIDNTGGFNRTWLIVAAVILAVLLVATFFIPEKDVAGAGGRRRAVRRVRGWLPGAADARGHPRCGAPSGKEY